VKLAELFVTIVKITSSRELRGGACCAQKLFVIPAVYASAASRERLLKMLGMLANEAAL